MEHYYNINAVNKGSYQQLIFDRDKKLHLIKSWDAITYPLVMLQ